MNPYNRIWSDPETDPYQWDRMFSSNAYIRASGGTPVVDMLPEPGLVDVSGMFTPGLAAGISRQAIRGSKVLKTPTTQWYHGTPHNIKEGFNPTTQKYNRGGSNEMTFFTRHPKEADGYSRMDVGSNLHRVEVSPYAKIFDPDNKIHSKQLKDAYMDAYGISKGTKIHNTATDKTGAGWVEAEDAVANAMYKANGYDGVLVNSGVGEKNLGVINTKIIQNSIGNRPNFPKPSNKGPKLATEEDIQKALRN